MDGEKLYGYGMRLRGFSPGCQPMDGFFGRTDSKCDDYYDVLWYTRELTDDECRHYSLDFIGTSWG